MKFGSLIVLGFNDTSTLVGHFVSSPREREKRDIVEEMKESNREERNRNESEETEVKTSPSILTHYKDSVPTRTVVKEMSVHERRWASEYWPIRIAH